MDWIQILVVIASVLAIIGSNVALFLWSRTESKNDVRHIDQKIDNLISAIQNETKDFHGRLCGLEAKGK